MEYGSLDLGNKQIISKMKKDYSDWKLDIERFKTFHRPDTVDLVLEVKKNPMTMEEFAKRYTELSGTKRGLNKGRHIYKFLLKTNWI